MARLLGLLDLCIQRLEHIIDQIKLLDQTFPLIIDAKAVLGHAITEHHRNVLMSVS